MIMIMMMIMNREKALLKLTTYILFQKNHTLSYAPEQQSLSSVGLWGAYNKTEQCRSSFRILSSTE